MTPTLILRRTPADTNLDRHEPAADGRRSVSRESDNDDDDAIHDFFYKVCIISIYPMRVTSKTSESAEALTAGQDGCEDRYVIQEHSERPGESEIRRVMLLKRG